MAHYEVDQYGNAPKGAKVDDYVTTAGGTYQIVDGASMTPEERTAQGIGYNPASGLYSKKVSNITTKDLSYQNYNTANQWKQQADIQAKQQLMADYNKNLSNAMQSYNTNLAGLKNQATEAQENYEQNVRDAQEAAYYSGQASMAGAANRGMTNSAQSQAAANSLLYGVGNTMAELNSDKNMLLDKIYTNINTLTQNYNIQLDELEKNKLAEELSMLNDNQLNYLAQIMDIDAFNADAYNNYSETYMNMTSSGGGSGSGNGGGTLTPEQAVYLMNNVKDPNVQDALEYYYNMYMAGMPGYTAEGFRNYYLELTAETPESNSGGGSVNSSGFPYRLPYDAGKGTINGVGNGVWYPNGTFDTYAKQAADAAINDIVTPVQNTTANTLDKFFNFANKTGKAIENRKIK